jgi:hypothetical protein
VFYGANIFLSGKPYITEDLIRLLGTGEHNYHPTYPGCYALNERTFGVNRVRTVVEYLVKEVFPNTRRWGKYHNAEAGRRGWTGFLRSLQ